MPCLPSPPPPAVITLIGALRNNADARRCSYFELGLPVCRQTLFYFSFRSFRKHRRARGNTNSVLACSQTFLFTSPVRAESPAPHTQRMRGISTVLDCHFPHGMRGFRQNLKGTIQNMDPRPTLVDYP